MAKYYLSTFYDDFYIVNGSGAYVVLTPACDYRCTRYDWAVISKKRWWQEFTREVSKEEFYNAYDRALRKRSGILEDEDGCDN